MAGERRAPEHGVAFLSNVFHRGGVTRWMVDAASEWRRRGWPVWFVAPEPAAAIHRRAGRPAVAELVRACAAGERPELHTLRVGTEFELGTGGYRAAVYARALCAGAPAGVPVIVSDDEAVWRGAASVVERHPLIGVLHSDEEKYYRLAERYAGVASALVAVSRRIAARARQCVAEAGVPIATIPCGVPLPPHQPAQADDQPALVRLAWVGRVEERQKRVSDLVRIAARLLERGVTFELTIAGDGPDRDTLRAHVDRLGLGAVVRVAGWQSSDEVARLLSATDLLLLPSNFEGMPVAVMEALAAGCGVVASRVSGIEDVEHVPAATGCVWVHTVGDVDEAATLIADAARVPRDERRQRARNLAEREFGIGTCVARYSALLGDARAPGASVAATPPWWRYRATGLVSRPVSSVRRLRLWIGGRISGAGHGYRAR